MSGVQARPTDSTRVSVARALGSTTRAGIYDHLRNAESALTVRDVAEVFDLHPNVARTHLGLLADAGLVSVGRRKHPGGGRPAKIYRAREQVDAEQGQLDAAGLPAGGAAAALMVRLLVRLLDEPPRDVPLASRAHQVAVDEGRNLVSSLPSLPDGPRTIEAVAQVVVRSLRSYSPEARVAKAGADWAEIVGSAALVTLVERVDLALAEAIERGLIVGACAAAGMAVALSEGTAGQGAARSWRLAPATQSSTSARVPLRPAGSVDTRGHQRETGVVEAMRAITRLQPGDVLEVLAEGPGSPQAFARWADRAGHELMGVERAQDPTGRPAIRLLIRKG